MGTALHIYKQLIIKELYVALQNIRGLIAVWYLRAVRASPSFFLIVSLLFPIGEDNRPCSARCCSSAFDILLRPIYISFASCFLRKDMFVTSHKHVRMRMKASDDHGHMEVTQFAVAMLTRLFFSSQATRTWRRGKRTRSLWRTRRRPKSNRGEVGLTSH